MGRKSKEEETRDYLRSLKLDPDTILQAAEGASLEVPDDPDELVKEFTAALYTAMKLGDLKSTALVQGLKAISLIAEQVKKDLPPPAPVIREIDEVLSDAGLPRDRRIEIGRAEIERFLSRADELRLVIARLEGET